MQQALVFRVGLRLDIAECVRHLTENRCRRQAMSKITNLRTVKKQMAREDKRRKADANAARHGRSKAERGRVADTVAKLNTHLDAHRRDQ